MTTQHRRAYTNPAPHGVRMEALRRYQEAATPLSFERWAFNQGLCDCGHNYSLHLGGQDVIRTEPPGECEPCQSKCEGFMTMRAPRIADIGMGGTSLLDDQVRVAVDRVLGRENHGQPLILTGDGAVHIMSWEHLPLDWEGPRGPAVADLADILVARGRSEWEGAARLYGGRTIPDSALFCAHANEAPAKCPCPKACYCKFNTCAGDIFRPASDNFRPAPSHSPDQNGPFPYWIRSW